MKGFYGADVTELTMLLVNKHYLNKDLITTKSGHSYFDDNVVEAVRNFQKDVKMKASGVVDYGFVQMLKQWDSSNTTIRLGVRDLAYTEEEIAGNDVAELVELLKKAGYAPDPSLIKMDGEEMVFTEDIATAVKMFQAYNGLPVTGIVDSTTLSKLRAKAK
jgi:murein L,D-transpeptidase YcbB/YkuD